ncbi:unnamed protein product [Calicophoron daubneyi]|uniref:Uncharacterized protein n=1 Tax=Calicophoron daubneyi TaxID=300641 RepID=A0AAV2TQZ4_CALDB
MRIHIVSGYFLPFASLLLLGGLALWKFGARLRVCDCEICQEDNALQMGFSSELRKTVIQKLIRAYRSNQYVETMRTIEDTINLLGETNVLNKASISTHTHQQSEQKLPEVCPEY